MGKDSDDRRDSAILSDDVVAAALNGAACAIGMAGDVRVNAVLQVPAAVLGRVLKDRLQAIRKSLADVRELGSRRSISDEVPARTRSVTLPKRPKAEKDVRTLDRAKLHEQALAARRAMVRNGELVDTSAMIAALGMSRQALHKAVLTNRIIQVCVDSTPYYPAFYASETYDRGELERVSRKLANLAGWDRLDFFTSQNQALGSISPLEALKLGMLAETLELAAAYSVS